MDFAYTAINATGSTVKDKIPADTEAQALQRLQAQGFIVLSLDAGRKSQAAGGGAGRAKFAMQFSRKVKLEQLVLLSREFAIMIETGVPIVEAIELLTEHAEDPLIRDAMTGVHTDLCEGKTLVQALSAHPRVFPKLYVDMVRTAETGGSLDETLNQAADYQEMSLEMRRKIVGAMTYPAILLVIAVAVVLFMLIFLLPQFNDMFTRMGADVPVATRLLLAASAFLHAQWWTVPITLFGGWAGFKTMLSLPAGRELWTKIMHRVPIAGDLIRKIVLARLLRAMGTLSGAGVPLLIALETAEQTAQDIIFERAMRQVRSTVEEGISLSEAVTATGVFPPMICQMMAVGEKSGRLSPVLLRIAEFHERDVEARLKVLTGILEPLMIVVLGVIVGFIAVSIITPIYSLVGSVK